MSEVRDAFLKIYRDVANGELVSPRGQLVREIENYAYELPPFARFQSFSCRKLSLSYIKRETLWYLRGDRFDASICDHAKLWRQIMNSDGSINSNYGQYVFGETNQFDAAVRTLTSDPDSRRASIMILSSAHLLSDTKDVPCTYALNFRIRRGLLNMSAHMRSQDAIFGMGNDAPAFSFIQEMLLNALRETYPTLQMGSYHHVADSFHVYERHFSMLDRLCTGDSYIEVDCPRISGPAEVTFLRKLDMTSIPAEYEFTKWLVEV